MEPKVDLTQSTSSTLGQEETTRYCRILGSLQYLTTTRPDISFAVSKLSQFFATPTVCHWQALRGVLRYVLANPFLGLLIRQSKSTTIKVYSDSDWAGDSSDKRNHRGYIVYLGGNLVSWQSRSKPLSLAPRRRRNTRV